MDQTRPAFAVRFRLGCGRPSYPIAWITGMASAKWRGTLVALLAVALSLALTACDNAWPPSRPAQGTYQLYESGGRTWRFNTATGRICVLLGPAETTNDARHPWCPSATDKVDTLYLAFRLTDVGDTLWLPHAYASPKPGAAVSPAPWNAPKPGGLAPVP